jgi:hypothetical protein
MPGDEVAWKIGNGDNADLHGKFRGRGDMHRKLGLRGRLRKVDEQVMASAKYPGPARSNKNDDHARSRHGLGLSRTEQGKQGRFRATLD